MAEQCTAKAKTTGKRCTRPAIPGGAICRFHGGAAPQVKAKAAERLAALVDPAIGQLQKLIVSKHAPTSLGACKDVLDRNGMKPVDKLDIVASTPEAVALAEIYSPAELESMRERARLYLAARRQLASDRGGTEDSAEEPPKQLLPGHGSATP